MSDPRRLRDDSGSDFERALLNAGVSYRASAETRAKTLAALGLAGSTAVLAGSASAATLASVGKATFAKVVAAVSLAGAVAAVPVGYYVWDRLPAAAAPAFVRPVHVAARAVPPTADLAPSMDSVAPVARAFVAPPAVESRESRGGSAVARSARSESKVPGAGASLTRELASLDAARLTAASGNARGALSILDRYSQDYPHGRLEIEAEVLRIDALASSGRGEIAKKRAEAFVRRYPGSVFAPRVRGYLDN